jgi:SHAQKYF class myb-like DNA-binding protein
MWAQARQFTVLAAVAPGLPTIEQPDGCKKAHKRRVNVEAATLDEFCSQVRQAVGIPDDDRFELAVFDKADVGGYVAPARLADVSDKARVQLTLRVAPPGSPGINRLCWTPPRALGHDDAEPKAEPLVATKTSPLPGERARFSVDSTTPALIEMGTGKWNDDEKDAFVLGLQRFGKNWKMVATLVKTRSLPQIRSYAQKFFVKWTWGPADELTPQPTIRTVAAQQQLLSGLSIVVTGSEKCFFAGGSFVVYTTDIVQQQPGGKPHCWTVKKRWGIATTVSAHVAPTHRSPFVAGTRNGCSCAKIAKPTQWASPSRRTLIPWLPSRGAAAVGAGRAPIA